MKIVSGSSNRALAEEIASLFGQPLTDTEITQFANGEKRVWIKEPVLGENVILVQSLSNPTDEHIVELLLLVDALERMGARHINLVMPWMGYSLQDKVFRQGEPIAAKVVANLISTTYIKRAFVLDLHNSSTPGFFSIPTHHITALTLFAETIRARVNLQSAVVASPDFGGLKRARVFAETLGIPLVNVDKQRDLTTGQTSATDVQGDVAGKTVIIFDDVINSGSTVVNSAKILKERGAAAVHFCASHGIFANNGVKTIDESTVDTVFVTNSITSVDTRTISSKKVEYLSAAPLFVEALEPWLKGSI